LTFLTKDCFSVKNNDYANKAGPGGWNDPDSK